MTKTDPSVEFARLQEHNRGRLTAIARTYAGLEADDLLQEILLQIWRALPGFQHRSNIDTWCYRIALNTAISWRRSANSKKCARIAETADMNQLPGAVDGHDPVEMLQRFLQTLSDADRAVVLMYLDGLSGSEMAEVLGLSEAAVRVRIHRIKCRIANGSVGDL